jgi:hypothetical protein
MSEEVITLRGGPEPDRTIAWRGGDDVFRPVTEPLRPRDFSKPLGDSIQIHHLHYRRSRDDPSRFDFVEIT